MEALNSIYRDLLPHVAEFLKLTLDFSDPYLKFLYTAFRQHLKVAPISKIVNGYLDYSGRFRDLCIPFQSGVVTLDLSNNELTNSQIPQLELIVQEIGCKILKLRNNLFDVGPLIDKLVKIETLELLDFRGNSGLQSSTFIDYLMSLENEYLAKIIFMDYGEIHFQMSRIREVVSIIHGLYFVNDKVNPVYTAQYIPSYRHYKELYETLSPGNS